MTSTLLTHNPTRLIHPSAHHRTTTKLHSLPMTSTISTPQLDPHIKHSMPFDKIEIFKSLEPWATKSLLPLLKPVEQCWQPAEFLPDPSHPYDQFSDEVQALRNTTADIPDEYFVVLVGDMITEEALPSYQTLINSHEGIQDETGASPSPWATWTRAWTAEENRHGDLLRTYLYLSGRVDMLMIDKTVQYLIGAGMDIGTERNPYMGYVYTSFQERATFISHCNTARLASERGDTFLAGICGNIAADEKRHGDAYSRIVEKLLEVDPTNAMLAIADMMRKNITMPAYLMYDGQDPDLFKHFSSVAQRLGVYTVDDYINIMELLIKKWRLEKIEGLTSDGRRAQEYVCGLAQRMKRIREVKNRADERANKLNLGEEVKFSWIFNKEVLV